MPRVTRFVQTLNKAQQRALLRVYERCAIHPQPDGTPQRVINGKPMTYRAFRRTVQFSFDCAMVQWCGMWLGIELDGYTHS